MSKDHTAPRFVTTNPATGQSGPAYDGHTMEQARDIVRATHAAFLAWRRTSFAERSALMRKVAAGLRTGAERFAELMADEMGKPVSDGRAEVEKCAVCCEFYADNAETFLARQPVEMGGRRPL